MQFTKKIILYWTLERGANFLIQWINFHFSYALWSDFDESNFGKKWHRFRFFMCKIVEHKAFEYFILVCIGLSSMSLVSLGFFKLRDYDIIICVFLHIWKREKEESNPCFMFCVVGLWRCLSLHSPRAGGRSVLYQHHLCRALHHWNVDEVDCLRI